jgi:aryl-alcohol dehydrogenase-like predicted oxidoreductase
MWAGALALDRSARDWYETNGLPVFAWSSGAHGFFAGIDSDDVQRVYFNAENFQKKVRVESMAKEKGLSPTVLAVAWTLNQPLNVFAIVGPRTVEEVREIAGVVDVWLTPEELSWLEAG